MPRNPTTCQRWSAREVQLLHDVPRVLVIDDNESAAEALATWLSYEGVEARAATGCTAALHCVRNWVPDVVVLDIMMPERDGYETASALRRYLPTHSLGIVAFTSLDEDHVRQTGRERHNFDGYCQKGTAPATLLALLRGLWRS
ncbi:response regulator [Paraburkholderia sp. MM5384-R2]|uniref:response regulator n=1 Tax=Paraburkholderia sp. MM5384-R2 TaxID=2723097 RepID=UPI0016135A78|nr:response regulator [Paraburkholderia sp. MM5384-R2]MBB5497867.1 CheY-like chemotaxis protein [Paraburkholderia sp. MM5384-R2]